MSNETVVELLKEILRELRKATFKPKDTFLTASEVRKITGTTNRAEQIRYFALKLNIEPFVCPKTGNPFVFREVAVDAQRPKAHDDVVIVNESIFDT